MTTKFILTALLTTLILSCNSTSKQDISDRNLREIISGEWVKINKTENSENQYPPPPILRFFPEGMTISNDSIEFYSGFYDYSFDSITGKRTNQYVENFAAYEIKDGKLNIKNPLTKRWESRLKFVRCKDDTLQLTLDDTTTLRYKRLHYAVDTLPNFDQIVYSSSGCYGSCPIMDISITKEGSVLFQGEGYVNALGFYSGILEMQTKKYVFDKFKRANPLSLQDNYSVMRTDNQSITTTFIIAGKIVKTIHDYGMEGPNELVWAYVPISNLYNKVRLDSVPSNDPFYPKLRTFTFNMGGLILPLEKSESFYLWTEIKKSNRSDKQFTPKYKLTFSCNDTYWGPDPNKTRYHKNKLITVMTNGRFYKFEFENEESVTYDLGYDFVERNFKPTDFRKPFEWEPL